MNLTGKQIGTLQEALLNAYRSRQKLKEMVKIRLDKNLDAYASGEDLGAVVFNLISVANSEGWSRELVVKAHEHNPGNKLLRAIAARLTNNFSEDGRPLFADQTVAPLEEFDAQSFLARLEVPGGAVNLRDQLYVRRQADAELEQELVKWGSTTSIRAPRQSGKTSLLMRGLHHATKRGLKAVFLNLQTLGPSRLTSLDVFCMTSRGQFVMSFA